MLIICYKKLPYFEGLKNQLFFDVTAVKLEKILLTLLLLHLGQANDFFFSYSIKDI